MRSRSQTTQALLAVAGGLLALAVYLAWRIASGGTPEPVFTYPDAPGVEATNPGESDPHDAPPPAAVANGASPMRVTVIVEPLARLAASPSPPAVRLVAGDAIVSDSVSWIAGPMSVPGVSAPGRHLVRFDVPGTPHYRVVDVPVPVPEAIDVPAAPPLEFEGRVLDTAGRGIEGAMVWLSGVEAATGADGTFRLPLRWGGSGLCLCVRAAGYAWQARVLEAWTFRTDPVPRFVLKPEAEVDVHCRGPLRDDATLELLVLPEAVAGTLGSTDAGTDAGTDGGNDGGNGGAGGGSGGGSEGTAVGSDVLQFPFWWQAIAGGVRVGAGGTATLRGLPRGARLRVTTRHPFEAPRGSGTAFSTRRPRATVLLGNEWPPAMLSGCVLDEQGSPLPGALVTASPPSRGHPFVLDAAGVWMLPGAVLLLGPAASADAEGRYALALREGSAHLVTAIAPRRLRHEVLVHPRRASGRDLHRDFVLPAVREDAARPEVRVHLPQRGRDYRARYRYGGSIRRSWIDWNDRQPLVLPVDHAMLADVVVRIEEGDGPPREQRFPERLLHGPVDVHVDLP